MRRSKNPQARALGQYEAAKAQWIRLNPGASAQQYEAAMRKLAAFYGF